MSFMFEVYYPAPRDKEREDRIKTAVCEFDGTLTFQEESWVSQCPSICLTFEFETLESAEAAIVRLQLLGEYVEGPYDY